MPNANIKMDPSTNNRTINTRSRQEAIQLSNNEDGKPTIRLRPMTSLIDKDAHYSVSSLIGRPRGHVLRKALKKNLSESSRGSNQRPVVDVFESLVNRKMTYAKAWCDCKCKIRKDYCDDCNFDVDKSLPKFGKVYPSPNDKCHLSAMKNNCNTLTYTFTQNSIDSSKIDISLPLKQEIKVEGFKCQPINSVPINDIPSIFGKVYVKKTPTDLNFLKRTTQDPLQSQNIYKNTAEKRKSRD